MKLRRAPFSFLHRLSLPIRTPLSHGLLRQQTFTTGRRRHHDEEADQSHRGGVDSTPNCSEAVYSASASVPSSESESPSKRVYGVNMWYSISTHIHPP